MKLYVKSSSYVEDGRYKVSGYYDSSFRGLEDDFQSDDWSEIENHAHEMLSKGDFVEITDIITGKSVRLDYDSYYGEDEENFNGEFPVKPLDLDKNWK